MARYHTITETFGWILIYAALSVFVFNYPPIHMGISILYWSIFALVTKAHSDKMLRNESSGNLDVQTYQVELSNGKHTYVPIATKQSIQIMLEYYTAEDVYKWCMRTYRWNRGYTVTVVDKISNETKQNKH